MGTTADEKPTEMPEMIRPTTSIATFCRVIQTQTRKKRTRERKVTYDGSALQDTAKDPNPTSDDNRVLPSNPVREVRHDQCTNQRSGRHRGDDATLRCRRRVLERPQIGFVVQHAGHRRDIETEEASADTGERADDILDRVAEEKEKDENKTTNVQSATSKKRRGMGYKDLRD
jgi:hypothetical protein